MHTLLFADHSHSSRETTASGPSLSKRRPRSYVEQVQVLGHFLNNFVASPTEVMAVLPIPGGPSVQAHCSGASKTLH
jgi:hypothetical protein